MGNQFSHMGKMVLLSEFLCYTKITTCNRNDKRMNKTESESDNKTLVENIYLFTNNEELLAIVPVHKEDIVNQKFKYLKSAPIHGMAIIDGDKDCWEVSSNYSVMNALDVEGMHVKVDDIVDSTTVNGRQADAMKRILHDYTDKVVLGRINKASLGYSRFHNGVDYDSLDPDQVIYDGDNAIKAKDLQETNLILQVR